MIISGQGDKSTDLYEIADKFARTLTMTKVKELDDKQDNDDIEGDYIVDEKARTCTLTPEGVRKAEKYFNLENLTDPENMTISHHINQAIRGHGIGHPGPRHYEAGHRLCGQGRRGHHCGRVHRPLDDRPPVQ